MLALFRNRAELKKAYGDLQEEIYRLKDLHQAAGRRHAARAGDAEHARGAAGGSRDRLSARWCSTSCAACGRRGASSSSSSSRTSRASRRSASAACTLRSTTATQFARRQAAETQLARRADPAPASQRARRRARDASARASDASGTTSSAARSSGAYTPTQAQLGCRRPCAGSQAQAAVEELSSASRRRNFPGLSLEARRAINIAAIAYAEVLCLRLASLKTPLVQLARGGHRAARGEQTITATRRSA